MIRMRASTPPPMYIDSPFSFHEPRAFGYRDFGRGIHQRLEAKSIGASRSRRTARPDAVIYAGGSGSGSGKRSRS